MSFLHTSLCAVLAFLVCTPVSSRPPSPGLFTHLLHPQLVHTPRFHTTPSHTHIVTYNSFIYNSFTHNICFTHCGVLVARFFEWCWCRRQMSWVTFKIKHTEICKSETVKTFLHIPKPDLSCQVHITECHSRLRWLQNYDIPCSPLHHEC